MDEIQFKPKPTNSLVCNLQLIVYKNSFAGKMARMVRAIGPVICLMLVVMDIVAGILGIEAQIAQSKGRYMKVLIFECREPSHEAYKLGMAAAIILALAHSIANALGGCVCIFSREELDRSSQNKKMAAGSLILSWIILIFAFSLLVIGAMSNSRSRENCGYSHQHALAIGGMLCFIHGFFLVPYYVSSTAASEEEDMITNQLRPPA
ncbi:hypothetical protein V2J09_002779 [Rumex salicifolius]